ncbi:LysR family transcriptional regulator [Roseomonas elaeocarpi]|uniref:LysR family transcriptional regulator n=1 Tax=Roseomonas elaeocarpi TaxID=907779 RepID=A0ABV6JNB9_9PROT
MHLDLPGLEAFLAIAELGSFHRAAQRLGLSQPALTRRMQRLEAVVGQPLLLRTGRPVQLTPAGSALLPEARDALTRLSDALRRAGSREASQAVRLGCLPTLAVRYLAPVLAQHRRRWRGEVVVYDSSATEIRALLERNELDFALAAVGSESWKVEAEPLLEEPFFLICPHDHRLARQASVSWAELGREPLVSIGPLSENRRIIEASLARAEVSASWRIEVRHLGTAVALVASGAGLTVLPASAVHGPAGYGLARVPLVEPAVSRSIGLLKPRDRVLGPAARALITELRAALLDAGPDAANRPA